MELYNYKKDLTITQYKFQEVKALFSEKKI